MSLRPKIATVLQIGLVAGVIFPALVSGQEMSFEEYEPRSTLVVPEHPLSRGKFSFVDAHNHQRESRLDAATVDQTVADMDKLNLAVMVKLSGGSSNRLEAVLKASKERYPDRFAVFANPSYDGIDKPGYPESTADQFESDVKAGAQGLKYSRIWE